jgi:hypothetical protein
VDGARSAVSGIGVSGAIGGAMGAVAGIAGRAPPASEDLSCVSRALSSRERLLAFLAQMTATSARTSAINSIVPCAIRLRLAQGSHRAKIQCGLVAKAEILTPSAHAQSGRGTLLQNLAAEAKQRRRPSAGLVDISPVGSTSAPVSTRRRKFCLCK